MCPALAVGTAAGVAAATAIFTASQLDMAPRCESVRDHRDRARLPRDCDLSGDARAVSLLVWRGLLGARDARYVREIAPRAREIAPRARGRGGSVHGGCRAPTPPARLASRRRASLPTTSSRAAPLTSCLAGRCPTHPSPTLRCPTLRCPTSAARGTLLAAALTAALARTAWTPQAWRWAAVLGRRR